MLLFDDLELKWTDFGSARIGKDSDNTMVTASGYSPLYCSPEVM